MTFAAWTPGSAFAASPLENVRDALAECDIQGVKQALEAKPDLAADKTILNRSLWCSPEITISLMNAGADLDWVDSLGQNVLMRMLAHQPVVGDMLRNYHPSQFPHQQLGMIPDPPKGRAYYTSLGLNPNELAAHEAVLEFAIKNTKDIHLKDKRGWDAASYAVYGALTTKVLSLLRDRGVDFGKAGNHKEELYGFAQRSGNSVSLQYLTELGLAPPPEIATVLLQKKDYSIPVSGLTIVTPESGRNELFDAYSSGGMALAYRLREMGAKAVGKTQDGEDGWSHFFAGAAKVFVGYHRYYFDEMGRHFTSESLAYDRKLRGEERDAYAKYYASGDPDPQGFKEKVRTFVEEAHRLADEIDVNRKGKNGETPLMALAKSARVWELGEVLVEKGAKIDARDASGQTALFYATRANNITMMDFLLSKGANFEIKDKKGKTFFQYLQDTGPHRMMPGKIIQMTVKLRLYLNAKQKRQAARE